MEKERSLFVVVGKLEANAGKGVSMITRVFGRKSGVVILAAFLIGPSLLFAQVSAGTGAITGAVTDATGGVIPGVEVTVRSAATNVSRTVITNEVGRYDVVALWPGEYEVSATLAGFSTLLRKGITVSVGQRAVVDLALTVSAGQEVITVTSDSPAVETDKSEVSTVINLNDMRNLPLNGRRWDNFVMTTPGASNDGGFGLVTFRGLSGLYNNNMIDGMDNNQAFFSEAKGRTRLAYGVSSEAIQEFQVGTSNFSAQYGRAAGGVVNAVTKSGTNDVHGTFFYLIRDDGLNAENPTAKAAGIAKPKDTRQQFGPSVGGALKKDKLFYFLSYDQQLRTFPAIIVPGSPTFLDSTGTAPGLSNVLNFYRGLQGPQDREGDQSLYLGRADWNINQRNQFSTTINILRWDSPNGVQTAPTHANHFTANGSDIVENETVIARWNSTVSRNFVSELRFQWGRDFEAQEPNAPGPHVSVTNGINFGMPNFLPRAAYPNERRWQVSQNLSWLRGRHSVSFGYDMNWLRDEVINLFSGGGVYSYPSANNLALDCPNITLPLGACAATPGTNPGRNYTSFAQQFDSLGLAGATELTNEDFALFVEDSWKARNNLTFNFGLRYELQTMPTPIGNPAVPATQRINTDKNNLGPRFGFAWDPFSNRKFAIRGGFGLYNGRTQNSTLFNLLTVDGVRFQSFSFQPATAGSPLFPQVFAAIPQGTSARPDVVVASSDFSNPLIYQGQFSIEQELFQNFTVTGIYLATRGQRMPLFRDTNLFPSNQQVAYAVCGAPQVTGSTTCSQIQQTASVPFFPGPSTNRPNAAYGRITVVDSVVNTWYHGFVFQAKQRFSKGFQMQASLTISKAIDDDQSSITFSTFNQPLNPFDVRGDRSLSDFDQRKRFSMSGYWILPFGGIESRPVRAILNGFQLSGILNLADGRPYSGGINGNPGPSFVQSGGILGVGGSNRVPFVGRNTFTSPGFASVDVRLARAFRLSERMKLELIWEAFNLLNRTNVTGLNTLQYNVVGTTLFPRPDFGTASATGTNLVRERQMQLGARFSF